MSKLTYSDFFKLLMFALIKSLFFQGNGLPKSKYCKVAEPECTSGKGKVVRQDLCSFSAVLILYLN